MLIIENVSYKNFFGSGNVPTEIDLCKSASTIITGVNGTGKTTVLFAIQFGLFGKCDRAVTKDLIVNTFNKKECLVSINFKTNNKQYKVVRGIKPNVFEIYENGVLLDQTDVSSYQELLEVKILKTNYKTFNQIVCMSPTSYTPFMRMPAAQRRQVIEDILDINVFSSMNVGLKEKITACKTQISNAETDISVTQEKVSGYERLIEAFTKNSMNEKEKILEEINQTETLFEGVQNKITALQSKIKDVSLVDLKEKLSKYQKTEREISSQFSQLSKTIREFENLDFCPTCKQDVSIEHKNSITAEASKKLDMLEPLKQKAENKIELISTGIEKINGVMNEISKLTSELGYLQTMQKTLKNKLKSIDEKPLNTEFVKDLKHSQEALDAFKNKKYELQELSLVYGSVKQLLSDTGIKSQIIKKYIPVINKCLNEYLEKLDFFVSFNLDESFKETIKSRYRDTYTYESFSEGQKQRIDLSILFAFRKVAKTKNSLDCNLLFFDEILDSHLDEEGVLNLLDILQQEEGTNIFVISHKASEAIEQAFDRKMVAYMNGNYGEIKEVT